MLARLSALAKACSGLLHSPRLHGCGCLASALAAVLVVAAIAVLGEYTKTRGLLLLTGGILAGFFLTGLRIVTLSPQRVPPRAATAGLAVAGIALALLLAGVWAAPDSGVFWKSAAILPTLAAALACAAWSASRPMPTMLARATARVSAAAMLLAAGLAGVGIAAGIKAASWWWAVTLLALIWAAAAVAASLLAWRRSR